MSLHRVCAMLAFVLLLARSQSANAQTCTPNQDCAPPDVAGVWHTTHTFDISAAFPSELKNGFEPLRALDQAIAGQLNLPPRRQSLEPILAAHIRQHLSPSLPSIIRLGDDLDSIFGTLRSEGALSLRKGVDSVSVKGSEVWTSLVFYWLGLCGGEIGGDPREPPKCARFDIATSDNDNPTETPQNTGHTIPSIAIAAALRPIDLQTETPRWQLVVDRRHVRVKMGKLVLAVIDELIGRTTPWRSIDEAFDCRDGSCVVDCGGLGASVSHLAPGLDARVEAICKATVRKAGRETMRALSRAWADAAVLEFSGSASIFVPAKSDGGCPAQAGCRRTLGLPEYEMLLRKDPARRDGLWIGSFFNKRATKMPGAWHATDFAPH